MPTGVKELPVGKIHESVTRPPARD